MAEDGKYIPQSGELEEEDEHEEVFVEDLGEIEAEIDLEEAPAESKSDSEDDADKEDKQDDGLSDSIRDFLAHNDAVYCVTFSPTQPNVFVTGGGDDLAYVWTTDSTEPKAKLEGHKDSIIAVGFSSDGKYLATACLDATLMIWNAQTYQLIHTFDGPSESLECLAWHSKGPVVVAGGGDGMVWMWNAEKGQNMNVFAGHSGQVNAVEFTNDGKKIVSVSDDASLRIWDPRTAKSLSVIQGFGFHEEAITSLAIHPDSPTCVSGSVDGGAFITNTQTGKCVGELKGHEDSVEDFCFIPHFPWVASASLDGKVGLWDISTLQPRNFFNNENGVTRLVAFDFTILSGDVTGVVQLWDTRAAGGAVRTWAAHKAPILDLIVANDKKSFITTSDDSAARLFAL